MDSLGVNPPLRLFPQPRKAAHIEQHDRVTDLCLGATLGVLALQPIRGKLVEFFHVDGGIHPWPNAEMAAVTQDETWGAMWCHLGPQGRQIVAHGGSRGIDEHP